MNTTLFTPCELGALRLEHRVVFTGSPRLLVGTSHQDPGCPVADYYGARSTRGGLVLCAVMPPPTGNASESTTRVGIHTAVQANSWRTVTQAIHRKGALAIARIGDTGVLADKEPDADDIDRALDSYRQAAENASDAGFDGVELIGTAGSMLARLLSHDTPGLRAGQANPSGLDFLVSALLCLSAVMPPDRVGLCIDLPREHQEPGAFGLGLVPLRSFDIAYTHLVADEHLPLTVVGTMVGQLQGLRRTRLIVTADWHRLDAVRTIQSGQVDAISPHPAFARDPDLIERWRTEGKVPASEFPLV